VQSRTADLQKFWGIEMVPSSVSSTESRVSALFSLFDTEAINKQRATRSNISEGLNLVRMMSTSVLRPEVYEIKLMKKNH
jgi:hypothetical protein